MIKNEKEKSYQKQNKRTKERFFFKFLDFIVIKSLNKFKNIKSQNQEIILNLLKIINEN